MSGIFQQVMHELGIIQYKSSPNQPENQGALERFHQTLKNMISSYFFDTEKDWMKAFICCCLPLENLFRNFLVAAHLSWHLTTLRGPLKFLKEKFLSNDDSSLNLLQYVSDFKDRLSKACEAAWTNLKSAQRKMKRWYDENAKTKKIHAWRQGTCSFAIPGKPLQARYYGPYIVDKKICEVNYIVNTSGGRKQKQLCHVNMLKQYIDRDSSSATPISVVSSVPQEQREMNSEDMNLIKSDPASSKL